MQDGIKVQAGKIHKIDKRAGWNKAVQDRKFQFSLVKIKVLAKKFQKINKRAGMFIPHSRVLEGKSYHSHATVASSP